MSRALPLLPLLVACAGAGRASKTADTAAGSVGPEAALVALHGQLIDPTLDGGALIFEVEAPAGCAVELELWTADGLAWPLATFTADAGPAPVAWDGRLGGARAAPQRLKLAALTDCGAAGRGLSRLPLAVVRLVPGQIALDAGAGAEPLSFAKADLVTPVEVPVDGAAYQLAGGVARDGALVVPPWDQPQGPAVAVGGRHGRGRPQPAHRGRRRQRAHAAGHAGRRGARRRAARPGRRRGRAHVPRRRELGRAPRRRAGPRAPDGRGRAPGAGLGWSACVGEGGGCDPAPVPGARETTHELYRLLGPGGLRDGRAEGYASDRPFIGALAATAAAVEGAADGPALMTALRGQLYTDPRVVYDPNVAAYSEHDGSYTYWDAITSELTAWLDRDQGLRLYCHSMSCLPSALGNTWGVDVRQLVLGVGLQTHLTRAAGDEDWPIWSFNSHSVATIDAGDAIWDASVDLDGDDDPGRSPVEPLAVTGLPIGEYLERLTGDRIEIVNEGKCWVRRARSGKTVTVHGA